jgi:hypothetical protein
MERIIIFASLNLLSTKKIIFLNDHAMIISILYIGKIGSRPGIISTDPGSAFPGYLAIFPSIMYVIESIIS